MGKEQEYTSTLNKLMQHTDRLYSASNGNWKPITLQISPTDKCNLKCGFCSVWDRDGDEIKIGDLEKTVDDFVDLGIKSAEITGGGDPTMYKDINRLINYIDSKGIDIGLITNGLRLDKINTNELQKLKWLRISLSALEKLPDVAIKVPDIPGTLGFSYVWNEQSKESVLDTIDKLAKEQGAEYVRIVPNCNSREEQIKYAKEVTPLLEKYPDFFFQTKPYDVHSECKIGRLKPFLNSDGNLYHCSAAPLYGGKFSKDWKMGHMSQAKKIWRDLPEKDTSKCEKGKCFYSEQNKLLSLLKEAPHENFV